MAKTKEEQQQDAAAIIAARDQHIEKIISMMCEAHRDEALNLSQDELKLKVINGFDKALQYGFTLDEHVIEFIDIIFTWGDDFDASDKTSWASEILSWKDTSNDARIRGLIEKSEDELEKKAEYIQKTKDHEPRIMNHGQ